MNAFTPIQTEDSTARHKQQLQELASIALGLVRIAAQKAEEAWEQPQPAAKGPDFSAIVTRLATSVRQAIALEAKLDGARFPGPKAKAAASAEKPALPDPRRDVLREAFDIFTAKTPDRKDLRAALHARIDQDLAADPDGKLKLRKVLRKIADDFGVLTDFARVPDRVLEGILGHKVTDPIPGYENWDSVAWFTGNGPPPPPLPDDY